jgi:hypothetical protein
MGWRIAVAVTVALACGTTIPVRAQERPANAASAVSAKELTREQFRALAPNAMIDFGNEQMTKGDFLERNKKQLEEAVKKFEESRARTLTEFEARHKALLDREKTALAEANKTVEAEVARLVAADAAAHGANWAARKKQAAELLGEAALASPLTRMQLEKQAADLLAPAGGAR